MNHPGPGDASDFLIQLIPILLLWGIAVPIVWRMARRKGVRKWSAVVGCFPFWIGIVAIYWASLTDKDVLDRLARLEAGGK